ncbi:hypothetical protein [Bradyrhizobium sp. 2S1]|uniref:hypothetical protein n=1 Tax=Bradyrhizobium sp. 2S1 TaxID=1404429 RepID=UPI0030D57C48
MASVRQIKANRRNAKRSTGPKTNQGKARSGRNALRHGLSRSMVYESTETDALKQAILNRLEQEGRPFEPAAIVSAQQELARVRTARYELIAAFLLAPNTALAKRIGGLARYESTAFAKQKRVIRASGSRRARAEANGLPAEMERGMKSPRRLD